nr:MFS transporter [uncultured Bacteroides sp.]
MQLEKSKNKALGIVIAIVFLNSVGMTIVFPLLPFLVGEYLPESQVVVGMSLLMSVFAACTFLAAPIFGALSDRYGRKRILFISLLGSVVGYLLFGIGGSLWILFLGRIIDGLTAGNISTLFAYISDITKPEERTKWFGYIGGATGTGFIVGPALGGWLGAVSISLPFFVTAALILVSALSILAFLPESLSIEKRLKHISFKNINTLQGVNQSLQSVYRVIIPLGAAAIYVYSPAILYIVAAAIAMGALLMFVNLNPKTVTA